MSALMAGIVGVVWFGGLVFLIDAWLWERHTRKIRASLGDKPTLRYRPTPSAKSLGIIVFAWQALSSYGEFSSRIQQPHQSLSAEIPGIVMAIILWAFVLAVLIRLPVRGKE